MITDAFAALTQTKFVSYRHVDEKGVFHGVTIRQRYLRQPYQVSEEGSYKDYPDELSAWLAAVAQCPTVVDACRDSKIMWYRAVARRAEILLTEGCDVLAEKRDEQLAVLLRLHHVALKALDARVTTRAAPKPMRLSNAKTLSWYETRCTLILPHGPEKMRFALRALPSPVEEGVWSAHFRVADAKDDAILAVQAGFERFVELAREEEGIVIKDAFNGTDMI